MSVRTYPHPVESTADLPTYCKQCGRRMHVADATAGFDPRSGAPVLTALATCSGGLLGLLFGADHDAYVVNPRPPATRPTPRGLLGSDIYCAPPDNSDDE